MKEQETISRIQDTLNSTDVHIATEGTSAHKDRNPLHLPELNRKRKDDFTIEELQQLTAFQKYSEGQLKQLLDVLKCFTRAVWQLQRNEQLQRRSIELIPPINPNKKAA